MNSQDALNIFLMITLFIFVTCVIFVTYFLVQALKAVRALAESIKDTSQSFQSKVGLKALAAIPPILVALVGKIIRRR